MGFDEDAIVARSDLPIIFKTMQLFARSIHLTHAHTVCCFYETPKANALEGLMTGTTKVQSRDEAGACSEVEWKTRVELAALYRVFDLSGMSGLVNQEVGARVEQQPNHFLVQAHGAFYDEVTASNLVKVNGFLVDLADGFADVSLGHQRENADFHDVFS